MKVLMADDHPLFLEGLEDLLAAHGFVPPAPSNPGRKNDEEMFAAGYITVTPITGDWTGSAASLHAVLESIGGLTGSGKYVARQLEHAADPPQHKRDHREPARHGPGGGHDPAPNGPSNNIRLPKSQEGELQ